MEVLHAILTRRSIRAYDGTPIPRDTLEKIVTAGMYSPSARNNRPWEFIVITDRALLQALSSIRPYWKMLSIASAAIAVLMDDTRYTSPTVAFSVQDCAAATENVLLAAHALGLGAVWLGLHPMEAEQTAVRNLLGIPEHIDPFSLISLGYPAAEAKQPNRFEPHKLHWNQYTVATGKEIK